MANQTSARTHQLFDRAAGTVRGAAIAVLVAGFSLVGWPTVAAASVTSVQVPVSSEKDPVKDGNNSKCRPHPGKGENPHCPPPVIPEAPMAVLLPVTAGGMLAGFYIYARRRNGAGLAV